MNRHVLKFWALGISVFIWFYVLSTETLTLERKVKVSYKIPKKFALVNEVPDLIKVTLKGPRAFLRSLAKRPLELNISTDDAIAASAGFYTFNLSANNFRVPLGVEVAQIEPSKIEMEIDKKVRKKVRVRARLIGEVNEGHRVYKQELHPRRIEIEGARKNVEKVKYLWSKPIEVGRLIGEGQERVQLEFPFPHLRKSSVDELIYSYRIQPTKANLTLNNVKIQFLTSFKIQESSHRFATLSVYATDKDEKDVREEGLQVVAYIPGEESGWVEVKLDAQVPEGVHVLKIFPDKIKVLIQ